DNLESASEVSPFAAHWDLIIVQRATYHGLFALGKVQEADVWLIRSRQIQDRKLKEEDISKEVPHEGLRVAWSFDDLVDNPPHVGT
ncbi:MAG: hypothetical protein KKD77_20570, partial [Gammaproteobacteria bacterium]|nr:hypothetical protein [Gammaproteobacteria bacterium]